MYRTEHCITQKLLKMKIMLRTLILIDVQNIFYRAKPQTYPLKNISKFKLSRKKSMIHFLVSSLKKIEQIKIEGSNVIRPKWTGNRTQTL